MKPILFILLVCCGMTEAVFSQVNYLTIQGIIHDQATHQPVAGVNVFLRKSALGTYSNEVGEFTLSLPDSLSTDSLTLSSIGYKTLTVSVQQLRNTTQYRFELVPSELMLQEVTVRAQADPAGALVARCLKQLSKTMATRQYLAEAFYRELSLRDSTYVRLIEAAVGMQDYGYGSSLERRKIKVVELRKSEDYITYGWGSRVSKVLFGEDNMLYQTVNMDFLRNYKIKQKLSPVDTQNYLDEYVFDWSGYSSFDGDSLAVIRFTSDQANERRPYYEGTLYINLRDLGVVRMEYGMVGHPSVMLRQQQDVFYQGKFFFKVSVDYRRIEGRYYLSRMTMIKPQNFDAVQAGKGQQFTVFDFAIHHIMTRKRDFDRIRLRDAQREDVDLYSQDFTYHPEFWEHYNMVRLNPLLKKAQTDLEQQKQLDEQFRRNGQHITGK